MTAVPVISVIVVNFNGRRWLAPCLDALAAQSGAASFETILVDNASSDGSAAFVRATYSDVIVHESGANLGFAAGNNAGARIARGGTLVFLNNDTIAAPDWLSRLAAALSERPACGMATSRIVSLDDPSRVDSAGDGYLRAGGAFKRGHGGRSEDYAESREVFGACGAAFAVRREVFDALGGFDESFFMVYEDVDLSYRAQLLGHRCWYAADAIVRHAGSATLGVASPMAVFHGQRNLEWTWLKNTPSGLLLRTTLPHLAYSLAGLAHYARRGLLRPALRGKLAAFAGAPRAWRARRAIHAARTASARDLRGVMTRGWIAAKLREKSF